MTKSKPIKTWAIVNKHGCIEGVYRTREQARYIYQREFGERIVRVEIKVLK